MAFGQVSRVSGDLVGDDAVLDVLLVRQAQVLLGCDIAEHRRAIPANQGRTDAGCDVVVTGRDIGGQRSQRVEGGFAAMLELQFHVFLDHLHRHVARAFDHDLNVVFPGDLGEFSQGLELSELSLVVGVIA